jgi:hypothetical protein
MRRQRLDQRVREERDDGSMTPRRARRSRRRQRRSRSNPVMKSVEWKTAAGDRRMPVRKIRLQNSASASSAK